MDDVRMVLGQRIVEAARLAMVLHLQCSDSTEDRWQVPSAGGAGLRESTDGDLPEPTDGPRDQASRLRAYARRHRSFLTAEGEAA